jgi:hypothetical protein
VEPQAGDGGRGFITIRPDQDVPSGYSHPYYWGPVCADGELAVRGKLPYPAHATRFNP